MINSVIEMMGLVGAFFLKDVSSILLKNKLFFENVNSEYRRYAFFD